MNRGIDSDSFLHLWMVMIYVPQLDLLVASACPVHSEPVKDPEVFRDFKTTIKPAYSTSRIANLTSLSSEVDSGNGWR